MLSSALQRRFTRRSLGRVAALAGAGAAMPFYNEFAQAARAAESSLGMFEMPPDVVRIAANENPAGPCREAAEAMQNIIPKGGYYAWGLMDPNPQHPAQLTQAISEIEAVKPAYIQMYAGSSDPLQDSVLAFCSREKSFVFSDPGYESGAEAAEFIGARVFRVPLTRDYRHDVKAMVAADPNAGIIYIANPNNPSGTITPKSDIEWALANKPKGSIIVLDEAYIHISQEWENRCSDLVSRDLDVVLLRTFSKLYGMAGLRAGFALARPDLLQKVRPWNPRVLPVTGMVGALASLRVKNLVQDRRRSYKELREDAFNFLDKHNIAFIKSDSNCFMMDVKRPAVEFQKAMMAKKVMVGRSWPVWPNYSRITVGSKNDMEKFKSAVLQVMA
jgi:histidinol-phosphate aminotransferase